MVDTQLGTKTQERQSFPTKNLLAKELLNRIVQRTRIRAKKIMRRAMDCECNGTRFAIQCCTDGASIIPLGQPSIRQLTLFDG